MKRYIPVLWTLLVLTLMGCTQKNNNTQPRISTQPDTILKRDRLVTNDGKHILLLYLSDSTCLIKWGQSAKLLYTSDTLHVLGSGNLNIAETEKNSILLKQSCGTCCQVGFILSISPPKCMKYLFFIASDLKNNLVAYISESDNSFITVENFITGEKQIINETNLCPAAFKGECIDSVSLANKQLFIKWQGNKWNHTKKDTRERKIEIRI